MRVRKLNTLKKRNEARARGEKEKPKSSGKVISPTDLAALVVDMCRTGDHEGKVVTLYSDRPLTLLSSRYMEKDCQYTFYFSSNRRDILDALSKGALVANIAQQEHGFAGFMYNGLDGEHKPYVPLITGQMRLAYEKLRSAQSREYNPKFPDRVNAIQKGAPIPVAYAKIFDHELTQMGSTFSGGTDPDTHTNVDDDEDRYIDPDDNRYDEGCDPDAD
jgi:hypothetical protein